MSCYLLLKIKNVNVEAKMNDISLIEVFINNERVGRLALTPERLCAFE